eukprot:1144817-Pelagomonas_calceolata.AAC.2
MQKVGQYDATLHGTMAPGCCFKFEVLVWRCMGCSSQIPANPLHASCFNNSPVVPHYWFHLSIMTMYAAYSRDGLSHGKGLEVGLLHVYLKHERECRGEAEPL